MLLQVGEVKKVWLGMYRMNETGRHSQDLRHSDYLSQAIYPRLGKALLDGWMVVLVVLISDGLSSVQYTVKVI